MTNAAHHRAPDRRAPGAHRRLHARAIGTSSGCSATPTGVRNRRDAYQREVLDRIVADLQAQAPDHIAVTGDLVNIGLPQEHINALAWLESLGAPQRVSVIPGNHDIYSRLRRRPGHGALGGLHGLRARRAPRTPATARLSVRAHARARWRSSASTRRCRRRRWWPRGGSAPSSSRVSAAMLERLGARRPLPPGADPSPAAAGPGQALARPARCRRARGGAGAARRRARPPRPQPPQHAGLVRTAAGGRCRWSARRRRRSRALTRPSRSRATISTASTGRPGASS